MAHLDLRHAGFGQERAHEPDSTSSSRGSWQAGFLPFLGAIDVGVSSSGMIELVRNALPAERRHEAVSVRLLNDERHAINPFDIGLGRRTPLPAREDLPGKLHSITLLGATARLRRKSCRGSCASTSSRATWSSRRARTYQQRHRPGDRPGDWRVADPGDGEDALVAARGRADEAWARRSGRAARRIRMPVLQDVSRVLADQGMAKDFTPELTRSMQRAVEAAIERYRIFSQPTRLDLGRPGWCRST